MTSSPEFLIFVVEDDPFYGEMLEYRLKQNPDYTVLRYQKGKDCLANLYRRPSVVTLDYSLPDMNGQEILKKIKQHNSGIEVVMVSGQEDISTAVTLLREGAYDYFVKDPEAFNRIWNAIIKIREKLDLKGEVEVLREKLADKFASGKTILGQSPAITKVHSLIERASKTNINVSIYGETGTGKELVAQAIHYQSERRKKPFIAVNLAAIPKDLVESELFGFEKGAFTGAMARKAGKFEEANGGTLFLDEVAEMDINLQAKLLRAIQEREVTRIGGSEAVKLDIRLLTATHRDLAEEVKKKNFREDLYFRLLGLPIQLPPLRERGSDILLLAKHFADEFSRENKLPKKSFSTGAKEKLLAYPFPGNVRELKAVMDLAVVMADQEQIHEGDISFTSLNKSNDLLIDETFTLNDYIRRIIRSYLDKNDNNLTLVAKKLDIGKSTLYRMRQNNEI
ncbi:MAG TPA: sigma-54 dependent transcriptional regulator [Bacteroidales bacterium]|nr:sigma-54 dependent transcriptional regulator [Bacteroidales bacterium]HPS62397.1 sigma-54 dependent transcriptional regulator [Bacteroidales bacterium]